MTGSWRVLDVCSGGGGAARGYLDAGASLVYGIDSDPAMRADFMAATGDCGLFSCADALETLANVDFVQQFNLVHISPPCQPFSLMSQCRPGLAETYLNLITPSLPLLEAAGVPYVVENVVSRQTRALLPGAVMLCGAMFNRRLYRHRLFKAGGWELRPPLRPAFQIVPQADGVRIVKPNPQCGWPHPVAAAKAGHWEPGKYVSVSGHERRGVVNDAMGIHWMADREHVKEAIPPAFAEYVGRQFAWTLEAAA